MICAVVGNGRMAVECIKVILRDHDALVGCVVAEKGNREAGLLGAFCESSGIPFLQASDFNDETIIARIGAIRPAYIFNINCLKIFGNRFLRIPRHGVVNFHNGPLPKYRGINVCSWAILNGETQYGVTWHFIRPGMGVDAGEIIAQHFFPVDANETAASLMIKCANHGIALFCSTFRQLKDGEAKPKQQDENLATVYYRNDSPNGGLIDFGKSFDEIDRLVRALNFNPLPNDFTHAKAIAMGKAFYVTKVSRGAAFEGRGEPGTILKASDEDLLISCRDSQVRIVGVLNQALEKVAIPQLIADMGLMRGCLLERPLAGAGPHQEGNRRGAMSPGNGHMPRQNG